MDTCCERIAELLCQKGQPSPRSLARLVEKTGLARSTVMSHLKHLEKDALLTKQEILHGKFGRPKMLYKPSPNLIKNMKTQSDPKKSYFG